MAQPSKSTTKPSPAISAITVEGFKSIAEAQTLEIRPLTILAGANSSGKSSMMQPLLLLKQTLEAQYDPGPLLLNGPNVKFTSATQFVSSVGLKGAPRKFTIGLRGSDESSIQIDFGINPKSQKLELRANEYAFRGIVLPLSSRMSSEDILRVVKTHSRLNNLFNMITGQLKQRGINAGLTLKRNGFSYSIEVNSKSDHDKNNIGAGFPLVIPPDTIYEALRASIHVRGLRGNPERHYQINAVGPRYTGLFENYVASLIASWRGKRSDERRGLNNDLSALGLTWKVEAKPINDTQVELCVGRLKKPKRGGSHDVVNIADVGFGVSQTLPVLVALRAAQPGQLVYIEQPEIHLHPRAQVAMAKVLAEAALRGVRVVAETHSSLLLLAVQTLVAEGFLPPDQVGLNWFIRDENDGTTRIHAAELDEAGRFGDWPEDFADTALEAESRYLSAAEARLIGNGKDG